MTAIARALAWGLLVLGALGCGAQRLEAPPPQPVEVSLVPAAGARESGRVQFYDLGDDLEVVIEGGGFAPGGAYAAYWRDARRGRPQPIGPFPSAVAVRQDGTALFEGVFTARSAGELVIYRHPDGDVATLSDMQPVLTAPLPAVLFR